MYYIDDHYKVTPQNLFIIEWPKMALGKKNSSTLDGVITNKEYPTDGLFSIKSLGNRAQQQIFIQEDSWENIDYLDRNSRTRNLIKFRNCSEQKMFVKT